MKRRSLSIVLIILICTLSLFSCNLFPNNNGGKNEDFIYKSDTDVSLILADESLPDSISNDIYNALVGVLDTPPSFSGASISESDHEIVIGKCDRAISKEAYAALEKLSKDDQEVGYVIYSNGKSVAIAYDEWEFHLTAKLAVEDFIKNYIKDELKLTVGVQSSDTVIPLEYYEEYDKQTQDVAWSALEEAVGGNEGTELVSAFKALYSVYGRDILTWAANLYSKRVCVCDNYDENGTPVCLYTKDENGNYLCSGGGFYYSESARDNVGFLPDVESTAQVLAIISSTGMTSVSGGSSYENAIPDWMREEIIAFVKSLQDADDKCFYHPQWGKDIYTTRRDRDLNWSVGILTKLGARPFYTPPTGNLSGTDDMVSYEKPLTGNLTSSPVVAVSHVVNAASSVVESSPWLESVETFKEYLAGFDLTTNSYAIGNIMTNQTSKIKVRDQEIGHGGTPLMDTLIDWFNEYIRPDTGHWHYQNDYYAVNAIMKILGVYNAAHRAVPTPDKMADACLAELTSSRQPVQAVELYNPWQAISKLITNLRSYAGKDVDPVTGLSGAERAEALVQRVREIAPDAIRSTAEKVVPFKKADGGLSYNLKYSAHQSQLVDTAIRNTAEGDVNGTALLFHGLIGGIYASLDLSTYIVPIFGESDRLYFMSIVEDLGPIQKDGLHIRESYPSTFDDEATGAPSEEIVCTVQSAITGSQITVIEDPRSGASGNVLHMYSPSGASPDSIKIRNTVNDSRATCLIFDGDMCIKSELASSTYGKDIEFSMGDAYGMIFKIKDGRVQLWEASSLKESSAVMHELASVPTDTWFNLRIEYYKGDADKVRIKVYVDKQLVAVTDNYYDGAGNKITGSESTPGGNLNETIIRVISNRSVSILFDNLHSYNTLDKYTASTDKNLIVNVDAPSENEIKYDFESGIPSDIAVSDSEIADIIDVTGGKALSIGAIASDPALTVTVPVTTRQVKNNLARISMDILANSAADGDVIIINLLEKYSTRNSILTFKLVAVTDGDERYLVPTEVMDGTVKKTLDAVRIPIGAEKALNLRFDYYAAEGMTLVYLDDVFLTASGVQNSGAVRYTYGLCTISTVSGTECDIQIDNIVAERSFGDFAQETKPENSSKTHDFEGTLSSDVTTSGEIIEKNGDHVLEISGQKDLNVLLNKRSNYTATAIFKAQLSVPTATTDGAAIRISFVDNAEGVVVAFDLKVSENYVTIHEVCDGTAGGAIAVISLGSEVELTIEFYSENKTVLVFADKKCIIKTNTVYKTDVEFMSCDYVSVVGLSDASYVTLDDVVAESYNKFYSDVKVESDMKIPDAEVIDFESATTATIPSAITTSLASSKPGIKIAYVMNSLAASEASKALVFDSYSDGNDSLMLGVTKDATSYNVVVFETDLCIIPQNTYSPLCQIGLDGANGTAYMLQLSYANGSINICDYSGAVYPRYEGVTVATGIKYRQWFNLRIEFYISPDAANAVVFKTYINGELKYVSDNFYGAHKGMTAVTEITSARITTLKQAALTIQADNMSLSYETKDYTADSFTHTIKNK